MSRIYSLPAYRVLTKSLQLKLANVPYFRDPISGTYSTGGIASSLYRWFLHFTRLGSRYCERLFRFSESMYSRFNQWSTPGSDIMKPVVPLKWSESSIYPGPINFASLIQQGKVNVVRGGLTGMHRNDDSEHPKLSYYTLDIDLVDAKPKQELLVDCVIFATGWKTGDYPFFSREQMDELGLPISYSEDKPPLRESEFIQTDKWAAQKVENEIYSMQDVPKLWQQAGYSARSVGRIAQATAPYRLYRLLVPISHLYQRDVVFPGRLSKGVGRFCIRLTQKFRSQAFRLPRQIMSFSWPRHIGSPTIFWVSSPDFQVLIKPRKRSVCRCTGQGSYSVLLMVSLANG